MALNLLSSSHPNHPRELESALLSRVLVSTAREVGNPKAGPQSSWRTRRTCSAAATKGTSRPLSLPAGTMPASPGNFNGAITIAWDFPSSLFTVIHRISNELKCTLSLMHLRQSLKIRTSLNRGEAALERLRENQPKTQRREGHTPCCQSHSEIRALQMKRHTDTDL